MVSRKLKVAIKLADEPAYKIAQRAGLVSVNSFKNFVWNRAGETGRSKSNKSGQGDGSHGGRLL